VPSASLMKVRIGNQPAKGEGEERETFVLLAEHMIIKEKIQKAKTIAQRTRHERENMSLGKNHQTGTGREANIRKRIASPLKRQKTRSKKRRGISQGREWARAM